MRTRIKICGLTREEDIDAAVQAGVDAIGFVFYPSSKRCLTPLRAAQLRRRLPAFVDAVALFVNATETEVRSVLEQVGPDLLQFHGDETPQACRQYGHRFVRAFRVGAPGLNTAAEVAAACRHYEDAAAWLFDSYSSGYGGSGLTFDHGLLDEVRAMETHPSLILSGGITPERVASAIRLLRPWAVDVSSGVETAPGIKSAARIAELVSAVCHADREPA